jgi:hypothetical protein
MWLKRKVAQKETEQSRWPVAKNLKNSAAVCQSAGKQHARVPSKGTRETFRKMRYLGEQRRAHV